MPCYNSHAKKIRNFGSLHIIYLTVHMLPLWGKSLFILVSDFAILSFWGNWEILWTRKRGCWFALKIPLVMANENSCQIIPIGEG